MRRMLYAHSFQQGASKILATIWIGIILFAHTPAAFAQTSHPTTLQSYLLTLAATEPTDRVSVIVQKRSHDQAPEQMVATQGGQITRELSFINAFVAELPAARLLALAALPAVRWIALDGPVHSVSTGDGRVHVRDNFMVGTFANSDGEPRWLGPWNEVGEVDGANAGDVAVVDFFGGALQGLRLQGSDKGVWRAVNLAEVTTATLMVSYRRKGFTSETDAVALELSTDNGASWQPIDHLVGPATDPDIQTTTYDLTPFVGGETVLRFVTAPTFTAEARFYLDSIAIAMEPIAGSAPLPKVYLPLVAQGVEGAQSGAEAVQAAAAINLSNLASPYIRSIGADLVWNGTPNIQGDGVTVAIVDSGVTANSNDLRTGASTSRIKATVQIGAVSGIVDDYYGHGSQVAGVIAGNGALSNGAYFGVAPNANLIDVKVTNDQGAGSTSDVIAGLQWIFTNRDTYNIKVVNLSLNSTIAESYHTSALNAAVEVLWFNKITVVVSAGNAGADKLFPPANDPFVITVGAMDDRGTTTISDDALASYSAFGVTSDGFVKPDLVAPGHKIVGLLASDDTNLVQNYPDYKVTAATGARYFKMSGTSVASAVVAGAVALLLQDEPTLTPDQVKYRLMATATPLGGSQNCATGAGYLNIYAAVNGTTTQSANTNLAASQLLWSGADPVAWNSVSWNSVSWNSVSWNSVSWNSVSWNSVSRNSVSWNSTVNDPNAITTMGSCTGGITGNAVTYLTLVNADTGQDIMAIGNGMVIDLSRLPTTNLNVRANVRGTVESVKFDFGGRYAATIDNAAPYARFGNNGSTYSAGNLTNGSQTIIATPYQLDNATGIAGNALAVEFTVINSAENKEFTSTLVAQHSSKCVNVPGASTNLNVQWQQATCLSGNSQAFAFKPVTNKLNTYTIVNRGNNLCMDVFGAGQTDATSIVQNACTGALNQQFILRSAGAGNGIFNLVAAHSGKCVNVNGAAQTDGAGLVQSSCTNAANQQWNLTSYVAINQLANNGFNTQLAPWYNTEGGSGLIGDAYNGNSALALPYVGAQSTLVQTGNALPNKQYVLKLYGKGAGGCDYGLAFYNKDGQAIQYGSGSFTGATNYLPFQKALTTPGSVTEFMVWLSRTSATSFCYFDQISLETR